MDHVADEIESAGRSEPRQLTNRMIGLIARPWKRQDSPSRRKRIWALTIAGQRVEVDDVLVDTEWARAVRTRAVILARGDTGLDGFPAVDPRATSDASREGRLPDRAPLRPGRAVASGGSIA